MWNTTVLFEKKIPVNTLNGALKQATVTLQITTKKDVCKFPRKKKKWFDQKGIDVKEHRKGVYLHHDKKCPMTLKNKACW